MLTRHLGDLALTSERGTLHNTAEFTLSTEGKSLESAMELHYCLHFSPYKCVWCSILYVYRYAWAVINVFFFINIFFSTHNTTQHPKYNKTKQQTHTQHLKVQSKGRERGKDNKNTKVTPPYNHVYQTKNTAKHQWSKTWPHRLARCISPMSLFAGGYGSNMFFHTCVC